MGKAWSVLKDQLVAMGDTEGEPPPLKIKTSPPRGQWVNVRERTPTETNLAHGDPTSGHPTPSKSKTFYLIFMVAEGASNKHTKIH